MFYHDHSFGLTRLNVYSGEAAGYLIVDPKETELINAGILPSPGSTLPISDDPWDTAAYNASTHPVNPPLVNNVYTYGIPLVFQDKTFVPGLSDLAAQDPTWDTTNWGGYGDLWYPHVYMPNQNPGDPSGANAMGRWDYGPWFWPPVPVATTPATPVNTIPQAHGPVPQVVNGVTIDTPGTPNPSLTPEAFMDTPVVNGTPYPTVTLEPRAYRFRMLNAANDRPFAFSFYYADPAAPTEVKMIPATPAEANTPGAPRDANGAPLWPMDGRDGGVVDWRTAGPDIIQIGNESGFLPSPVIHKSQATTYNYNRRDIVVLDVANHGLFLAPAERADVIVDFSSVPSGSTLILYNDMLAPVPAFDVRYDYFTGAPDQTPTGGAPSPLPGYGPNTRTLMQVKIVGNPAATFDVAALQAAFKSTPTSKGAFEASQHTPIVPQTFYNDALNTTFPVDTYATIQAYQLNYNKTENGVNVTEPLKAKAIQELFELDYGRMNATLGVELPFTNFNNQTTIPLGYSEPATEVMTDGITQLWKITHNGVDTHPVHFHLFDVQVVNRVGWDGAVRFPEANELGWKETVRMKPLEDIIVAMRPLSPKLPFTLGNSVRVLDPTKDPNASISVTDLGNGFVNLGNIGNQILVSNSDGVVGTGGAPNTPGAGYYYGWEYVWHCHILGHEENDFMRPLVLDVAITKPGDPTGLTATPSGPTRVDLTWTKTTLPANVGPLARIPVNETGFRVERKVGAGAYTTLGYTVPDENHFSDMTAVSGTTYDYRVYSYNQAGDSLLPATATVTPGAITNPTTVALAASPVTSAPFGTLVTFTATPAAAAAHQFQFLVSNDGGVTFTMVQDYSATATYSFPLTQAVGTYTMKVNARTSVASTIATANIAYIITPGPATGVQLLPNFPSPRLAGKGITFTATGIGSTGYQYQYSVDSVVVQAYSAVRTYTLDPFIAAGAHLVQVDVRTNAASLVPDASATMSYTVLAAAPATGVTLTASTASPFAPGAPVLFTAVGSGALNYQYLFLLYDGSTGIWSQVQAYGTTSTYSLPTNLALGNYILEVQVRATATGNWQAFQDFPFRVGFPPATGVSLISSAISPFDTGIAVQFTALGSGSSNYEYSYLLYNGTTGIWSQVQAFSTTPTYSIPNNLPLGNYILEVQVRAGSIGTWQAFQDFPFKVGLPAATGVTLTPNAPSPFITGASVVFTAAGVGSSNYQYAFLLYYGNTGFWYQVQGFSTTPTYSLPVNLPAGNYIVEVQVRAGSTGTWQAFKDVPFTIQ